uniref:Uncharacterized protein n=1 Tax=Meloidogyne javanica TaxID=6303 RepID=A0A915M117_MELJA
MRSGQKRPLIEPPDNRTPFCLTELSFLIITLIYTTDDELFGEPGNVTQVKTVYEILEQIGNGKLEEFGLQNDQNFGQITPKLINVINHFENNLNEHQTAINIRINQLIENYNNALNGGNQAMINRLREQQTQGTPAISACNCTIKVYIPGRPEIGESSQHAGEGTSQQAAGESSQHAGDGTSQQAAGESSQHAGEGTSQQAAESSSTGASGRQGDFRDI